jgi:acid phosphatase family membrane protein YuiD
MSIKLSNLKNENKKYIKNKLVESKISNNKDFQNHSIKLTKYLIHKIMEVFSQVLSSIINNQITSIFIT